ncbi:hypothetical protein [Neptuniibacter halophilus]|uniref:hypothetical protein n=1 Tax=Neptuniibacter halophilus TaxID=651666 RepID=UPI002573467F|nr:hypothetical protein [Neptuniibacter halophilus]
MFRHLLAFLLMLLAPGWMRDRTPDEKHFYRRFFTRRHRAKRSKAKLLWIAALCLMLFFPYPPLMVALLLFTTFITFSLMDESN